MAIYNRYSGGAPHGQLSWTYGSKFSYLTTCLIFNANFSIALIYCEIVETANFDYVFLGPMMLMLIILFIHSKMLGLQLRIMAIDRFDSFGSQNHWLSCMQIKLCKSSIQSNFLIIDIFSLACIVNLSRIYFNSWFIWLLFSSIWIPQIYHNTIHRIKFVP